MIGSLDCGPASIAAPHFPLHAERRRWLYALDRNDQPLRDFLEASCPGPRLGLMFECLWHFFLREDPETTLVANNLPVRENGRTLGEFDILYYCHQRAALYHLELAVKFYLFVPALTDGRPYQGWLGPNQVDRLDRKLHHLCSHQLALSRNPAAQQQLRKDGLNIHSRQVQVSGRLFSPLDDMPRRHSGFTPNHPRGDWQRMSSFLAKENPSGWRYLAKPHWLDADFRAAMPLRETHFALAAQRPVMLVDADQRCRFICPDHWPVHTNCLSPA